MAIMTENGDGDDVDVDGDGDGDGGDDGDEEWSQWKMTGRCTFHWLAAFSNPCHTLTDGSDDDDFAMLVKIVIGREPACYA